jgi:hypothetical protein
LPLESSIEILEALQKYSGRSIALVEARAANCNNVKCYRQDECLADSVTGMKDEF